MDADALHARLEAVLSSVPPIGPRALLSPRWSWSTGQTTPPPDIEEERKVWHQMEDEARNLLEQDGCPPCYPPDPSYSVQNPLEEYREIISYWEGSFAPNGGGALNHQWVDWCKFHKFQEMNRRHYAQRFTQFTGAVCERRGRYNLSEDVCLRLNPKEQTRQETWVEFQDYHLHYYECFEKDAETESKNLDTATEKLRELELAGPKLEVFGPKLPFDRPERETIMHSQMVARYRLAHAHERMKGHKKLLLPWIERERVKMTVTTQSAAADDIKVIRKTPTRSTRNRKSSVRSIPDSIQSAVSKRNSQKRSLRSQRPELSSPRPKESTFDLRPSESTITQKRDLPSKEESRTKTRGSVSRRALHPHKVTKPIKKINKSKQQANNIDASSRLMPPSRKLDQRKPKPRGKPPRSSFTHQNLTEDSVTNCGRVSRKPKRPRFISF